ncbi:hypothetical protein L2E82_32935 [Cichorium intybus]|uniref:Uncharacterized protein n=1 Tax=Cichorium intybus TaxID=13427 RepID=A0ACB9BIT8_CICIN|nr:hypothetical protein L1887_09843 [Cichorium endivia]KAI3721916.1 hypothetical protein L2E82_32935 [Cichorium intybus]
MVTTKQQIAFHRSPTERREFLLDPEECSSRGSHRLAEVAGGTTAECAAVVCCFPCTVVNFLVLAVYKVPAGLCRKALRKKRRRRLLKKGLLIKSTRGVGDISSTHGISIDGTEFSLHPEAAAAAERLVVKSMDADEDLMELENEMWETFYGTGFWRSLSQRID